MLAKTKHIDVSDNDHLVVILGKDGIVDSIDQSLLITFRHPQERFGVSFRSTFETFSIWIFADTLQDSAYGLAQFVLILGFLVWGRV